MTDAELIAQLEQHKALIVHCSRPGKGDEATGGLLYPNDLKHAIDICSTGTELCCSVIWPSHLETFGSIGIIVKPRSTASITSICFEDAGSHVNSRTGKRVGLGVTFSRHAMLDTFTNATGYNEWSVRDADTIGVFVQPSDHWEVARRMKLSEVAGYDPAMGDGESVTIGAVTITASEIMTDFPHLPLYSFAQGEIIKVETGDRRIAWHPIDPADLYR